MSILTRTGKASDFDATALELTDVSPALAARASSGLTAAHHLGGWCGVDDGGAAVVAFQLDHGAATLPPPVRPRFWLEPINKFSLGYGLRLIARDGKTMISQAWLRHDDPGVRALLERRVATMLFFRGAVLVGVVAAVWTGTDALLDEIKLTRRLMRDAHLPLPASFGSLGDSFLTPELLTIRDRAAAARFYAVEFFCQGWAGALKEDRSQILATADSALELPEPFARAVAALRSSRNPMPALVALAEVEWSEHRVRRVFAPYAQLEVLRSGLLLLAVASDAATEGGTRLACLGYRGEPGFVALDLAAIERQGGEAGLLSYWRCIVGSTTYLWDRVLTGAEMPAWPNQVVDAFPEDALVTDPEAARVTASDLIHEAVRECQGTIPYGATVELRVAPFTHANVYPFVNAVLFQCWTTSNEFLMQCVWLKDGTVSNFATRVPTPETHDLFTRMDATLAVMLAAIVRDFWVTERRERVFATRVERASPRQIARGAGAAPTVVYLPRVRYARAPDLERGARELRLVERRTHDVAPHLRRAGHASVEQMALAAIYGMDVPDGFTYVRAHRRGTREVDVVYRSRSALQAIYEPRETSHDEAAAGWFRFEAAVRQYIETQQLSIEHWSAMVDGIEIFATPERGEGMCLIHAFDRERVGAGHVEGLVRRRAEAPSHVPVRAFLLVRGDASPSAVERGAAIGVEIVDRIVAASP